jgi:hypothetical protein
MLVTVVVVLLLLPEVPPLLPPDELLPDVPPVELRATLPTTLKVTVNGSLFGLLNFIVRAAETSLAVKALSVPSFVL